LAAVSFGPWYYSVTVETYMIPLCLLFWASYLLTRATITVRVLIAAGFLHGLAMLFHQASVLFGAVCLVTLMFRRDFAKPAHLSFFLAYFVPASLLVVLGYVWAAIALNKADGVGTFLTWCLGHASDPQLYVSVSLKTPLLAAVGFTRSIIGGHFAFAVPQVNDLLSRIFVTQSLNDERFLVRELSAGHARALLLMALSALGVLAVLATRSFSWRRKNRTYCGDRLSLRTRRLLWAWFASYTLFFTFWDPSNVDFWVTQNLCFLLLLGGRIESVCCRPGLASSAIALVAGLVFAVNGSGTIWPAMSSRNDFHQWRLQPVQSRVVEEDLLIIGDAWPAQGYLSYLTEIRFLSASQCYRRRINVADIAGESQATIQGGHDVYIYDDVINVDSSTRAFLGPDYVRYVEDLTQELGALEVVHDEDLRRLRRVSRMAK
jgi:hypothetical protein